MYGLFTIYAMDASKIHSKSKISVADSFISGYLRRHCSEIFSKTVNSILEIHNRVKFAVNLQIFSLAKFDVLLNQRPATDYNFSSESMSALSNGCFNFDEAMLISQQKERALNEIYKMETELSLDSSKFYRTELDFICSSLNSAVRRISFMTYWQSFSEPRISYSHLLRIFCQNLSRVFNRNLKHLESRCFNKSEDHMRAAELGKHCHIMSAGVADETVGISTRSSDTFSSRFSQGRSERNTNGLIQIEPRKFCAGLTQCTKNEPLDSSYSNTASCCFHRTAVDKLGKLLMIQNSNNLDDNLSVCDLSSLFLNDTMIAITDSSGQLTSCSSSIQSSATCDVKASRHIRQMQSHSVQQHIAWSYCCHKFCRKQNQGQTKSITKLQHKSYPPMQVDVVASLRSHVSSDTDVEYLMAADSCISQKKMDLDMNLKFNDVTKVVNGSERLQTCLEVRNYEPDKNNEKMALAHGTYGSVVDDKEIDDDDTDEESPDEEEMDEDVLADDESNSVNSLDDEITDDETVEETDEEDKIVLNDKATSAGIKTLCKSSFFILPSEVDSSDLSSDSDGKVDEDDLEVDEWDSSDQSADSLISGVCESFSFNGLYFPSSCSSAEAKLSLEELKESDRTRLLSASNSQSVLTPDCSWIDNSCDDIVFCDDQESHCCSSDDEEDLPLTNLSRLESINARWNDFYLTSWEVEKPTQNQKQVRFARDSSLVTTYAETISETEDYAAARKGPWEEYARDRDRFKRRIRDTSEQISWILSPVHRNEVYKKSFSKS